MDEAGKDNHKWVAGGIRWSTDEQRDGTTEAVQKEAIKGFVGNKYPGYEDTIKWYIDDGISGVFVLRPAIKEMLADAEAGKLIAVVFHRYDRLARKQSTAHRLWYERYVDSPDCRQSFFRNCRDQR